MVRTDKAKLPKQFSDHHCLPFDGCNDPAKGKAQLDAIVAEVRHLIAAPVYRVIEASASTLTAPPEFGDIPGAPDKLIGRDEELGVLHRAWDSRPRRS